MERTIKFRGKTESGEWVYGSLLVWPDGKMMIYDTLLKDGSMGGHEVKPETVGEFTGFYDTNGRAIYEDDIIRIDEFKERGLLRIVFYESSFAMATLKQAELLDAGLHPFLNDYARLPELGCAELQSLYVVVANIHDCTDSINKK